MRDLLRAEPVAQDPERGLDHGAYVPLVAMYPAADVPVLQVSLPSLDPTALFSLGRSLASLRREGVLIVGSGFLTHNLRTVDFRPDAPTPAWASEFDAWAGDVLARRDVDALLDYRGRAPGRSSGAADARALRPGAGVAGRRDRRHRRHRPLPDHRLRLRHRDAPVGSVRVTVRRRDIRVMDSPIASDGARPNPVSHCFESMACALRIRPGMRINAPNTAVVIATIGLLAIGGCIERANIEASCAGEGAPTCLDDRGNGECSDVSRPATCSGGQWSCPAGTVAASTCVCLGPPPTVDCTCTSSGWSCPSCSGVLMPTCLDDHGNGECSDVSRPATCSGGQWSCPAGTLERSTCACLGPPPTVGCTCMPTGWRCPSCSGVLMPTCLDDRGNGECSDVSRPATCSGGRWSCPAGTLERSTCVCLGPPPTVGCTCTFTGWSCPGAGLLRRPKTRDV